MDKLALTPEMIDKARQKGITISDKSYAYKGDDGKIHIGEDYSPDDKPSTLTSEQPQDNQGTETMSSNERTSATGAFMRAAGTQLLPAMLGRVVGAGAGALTPTGPFKVPLAIAGGVLGGVGAQMGEEYGLNKIAQNNPQGLIAKLQHYRELDQAQHPTAMMLGGLTTLPAAGGGKLMIPKSLKDLGQLGKIAGLQGSINATVQAATSDKPIEDIVTDPNMLGASALSALLSKPIGGMRNIERIALKGLPPKFLNEFAPAVEPPVIRSKDNPHAPGTAAEHTWELLNAGKAGPQKLQSAQADANTRALQDAAAIEAARTESGQGEKGVPQAVVKPAAESAAAIAKAEPEVDANLEKAHNTYQKANKNAEAFAKTIESLPDGDPRKIEGTQRLAAYRDHVNDLYNQWMGMLPKPATPVPAGVSTSEIAKPIEGLKEPIEQPEAIPGAKKIPGIAEGTVLPTSKNPIIPENEPLAPAPTASEPAAIEDILRRIKTGQLNSPQEAPITATEPSAIEKALAARLPKPQPEAPVAPVEPPVSQPAPQVAPVAAPKPEPIQPNPIEIIKSLNAGHLPPRNQAEASQLEQIIKANQIKGLQSKAAQEAAAKKGGQAGSVASPFQEIGNRIDDIAKEVKSWFRTIDRSETPSEEAAKLRPLDPNRLIEHHHGTKSVYKEINEIDPVVGEHFTKQMYHTFLDRRQMQSQLESVIEGIRKATKPTAEDSMAVTKYMSDMRRGVPPSSPLTPKQVDIANALKMYYDYIGEQIEKSGILIKDYRNDGSSFLRPFNKLTDYYPEMIAPEVDEILRTKGPDDPTHKMLVANRLEQIKAAYGVDDPTALKIFEDMQRPGVMENGMPNPAFAGVRKAHGIGLPESWVDNDVFRVARRYANRVSTDLAFHNRMETDPVIAKALGLRTDGSGNAIPESVIGPDGKPLTEAILKGKDAVETAFQDYAGFLDPTTREYQKYAGIASNFLLGPTSRGWHAARAANAMRAWMSVSENRYFVKAIGNMLKDYSGTKQQALQSGSLFPRSNVAPMVAMDHMDHWTRASQIYSTVNGAEGVTKASMTMLDQVARMIAGNRMLQHDTAFFDKWAQPEWRELIKTKEGLSKVMDNTAANMTTTAWGTYTGKDLPGSLVRGSANPLRVFVALARAPIGRYNSWLQDTWAPATHGQIGPLVHQLFGALLTAEGLEFLKKKLTGLGPPELTAKEFANLGGDKDIPYTFFSKMVAGGFGGIMPQIAMELLKFHYGELGQGADSPGIIMGESLMNRLAQFENARRLGETDIPHGLITLAGALAKDNLQAYRQFIFPRIERGKREEAIARRLGYIPPLEAGQTGTRSNPFSTQYRYLYGDTSGIRSTMAARMARGQALSPPEAEWEGRTTPVRREGQLSNYYEFIRQAQGEAAMQEAMKRDQANTEKKWRTLSSALAGR